MAEVIGNAIRSVNRHALLSIRDVAIKDIDIASKIFALGRPVLEALSDISADQCETLALELAAPIFMPAIMKSDAWLEIADLIRASESDEKAADKITLIVNSVRNVENEHKSV